MKKVNINLITSRVRAWIDQIRTNGTDTLWDRLSDTERDEFIIFTQELENGFLLEEKQRWQDAADIYKTLAEKFPAYSDISISRASYVISDKINRSIRYYNQGVQSLESKMYAKAIQYFGLALMIDSRMEKALYNLGMAYKLTYISNPETSKDYKLLAIDNFKKTLEINPENHLAKAQIDYLRSL